MRRHLGVRIALVAVVIAVSVWYLYPPAKTINLGLDLQGGIHLVLGVDVDKAIEAQVERAGGHHEGRARDARASGSRGSSGEALTELVIQLASPQSWDDALTATDEVLATFDRKEADQAAGRIVLALKPREAAQLRDAGGAPGARDHPQPRRPVRRGRAVHPAAGRQPHPRPAAGRPGSRRAPRRSSARPRCSSSSCVDEQHRPVEPALRAGPPPGTELLYQRRVDKQTKAGAQGARSSSRRRRCSPARDADHRARVRSTRTRASPTSRSSSTPPARAAFARAHRGQRGQAPRHRPRRQRLLGAADPRAHPVRRGPRSRAASPPRRPPISPSCCGPARCPRRCRSSRSGRSAPRSAPTRSARA